MHPTQHYKERTNLIMSSFALLNTYNYITSGQILDEYSVISEKCVVNMAGILYGYATIWKLIIYFKLNRLIGISGMK